MSSDKREKRFLELVRSSGLVAKDELERTLAFQEFALDRGKPLPLDRILIKFGLLGETQVRSLYLALRYFTWRKEDKFYAKIAVQSQVLAPEDAERCLKEQKRAYKEKHVVRRVNEIALDKGLLGAKEDAAIIEKIRSLKPRWTLAPLVPGASGAADEGSSAARGPARKGEEEQWRREMRARELAELSNAAREDPELSSDAPIEVDLDDSGNPQAKLSMSGSGKLASDEDLDPLWDEADLDDIELDSGQAEAARGSMGSRSQASDEDDTDLFG